MAKMRIKCYKESLESEKKALKTEISRIKAELPETFLTISKALNALELLFPQICAEYKSLQLALEELYPSSYLEEHEFINLAAFVDSQHLNKPRTLPIDSFLLTGKLLQVHRYHDLFKECKSLGDFLETTLQAKYSGSNFSDEINDLLNSKEKFTKLHVIKFEPLLPSTERHFFFD
ncbi:Oidioi.mRNA.OKI2018_I69.PAR.g9041.t1.cds [Oikopleura dioica]|uniref:Oidioi.mRNA.OKI2018_I69.PAR.g9041.t1.cds n=1 Tax=Oikopleura dioica TaxID=34765 RepID=A0ABN7RN80_OIKDI|nr:Oidioi.mRNA.OKI2018_I69.PAR.g9041.t1.cds [Oikopleura dioica]